MYIYLRPHFTPSEKSDDTVGVVCYIHRKIVQHLSPRTNLRQQSSCLDQRPRWIIGTSVWFSGLRWVDFWEIVSGEGGLSIVEIMEWMGGICRISMLVKVWRAEGDGWLGVPPIRHYCYCHFYFTAAINITTSITATRTYLWCSNVLEIWLCYPGAFTNFQKRQSVEYLTLSVVAFWNQESCHWWPCKIQILHFREENELKTYVRMICG